MSLTAKDTFQPRMIPYGIIRGCVCMREAMFFMFFSIDNL